MITLEQVQAGLTIVVDKPRQWTSFQAVNKVKSTVRRLYGLKQFKIGHAGTLDPLATGILLVCLGKATKQIPTLQDGTKEYTGTFVFGATTPCYDMEQPIDHRYPYSHITAEQLVEKTRQFTGPILQVPPMFSAVKIDGQRAYQYARIDDPTAVIQPKRVVVERFDITGFRPGDDARENEPIPQTVTPPTESQAKHPHFYVNPLCVIPEHLPQADFHITCGKGTYIRSIARDLGLALDSGAFLASLRRTRVGDFTLDQAVTLDNIETYFTGTTL